VRARGRGALAGVFALVLALAACGGGAPPSTAVTPAEPLNVHVSRGPVEAPLASSTAIEAAATPSGTATGVAGATPAAPAPSAPAPAFNPPLDLVDAALPPALLDAATQVRAGAWRKAKTALGTAIPIVEKGGAPDDVAVANALLGRTHAALGDRKSARKSFDAALAAADASEPGVLGDADEARRNLRLARLALVRGEALFDSAEEKRAAAVVKKAPVYRGSGSASDLGKFASKELAPWMNERRAAIAEAEEAYRKVLDVKPMPPPIWVVASAERVADLHATLVQQLSLIPMPAAWNGEGELNGVKKSEIREAYRAALDGALEPMRAQATAAYRVCVERAQRFGVQSDAATRCQGWLAKQPASKP
jgi:tetratricopeptide (TPR) repeat protein